MLLNSKSERVYVNHVSGLSFLHFLKKTLKDQLGPSRFTTEPATESILEPVDNLHSSLNFDLDALAKNKLVETYFIAVEMS